jgi:hypothetical protein
MDFFLDNNANSLTEKKVNTPINSSKYGVPAYRPATITPT